MPTSCWSSTGTAEQTARDIAAACGARHSGRRRGKGAAIRRGIQEATGDILVFVDADGSHDPADVPTLVEPIIAGRADHVSGSRMLGGSDELHATIQQFVRLFGNQVITLTINYTLGVRLTDCQNGAFAPSAATWRGPRPVRGHHHHRAGDDH